MRHVTAKIVEMKIPRTTRYEMMKRKGMEKEAEKWLIEEIKSLSEKKKAEERMKGIQIIGQMFNSLGRKSRQEALNVLKKTAKDKEIKMRQATVLTLGRTRSPQMLPILEKMANDKNSGVRLRTVFALKDLGEKALPALEKLAKDEDVFVKQRALLQLKKIKGIK